MQDHHVEVNTRAGYYYNPKTKKRIYDDPRKSPRARRRLNKRRGMAADRLAHVELLIRFRLMWGVCHPRPTDWLLLVVDILAVLVGRFITPELVARYICPHDRDEITPAMIAAAIAAARRDWLIGNPEAGTLANLDRDELMFLQEEDGTVLRMHPIDETPDARTLRRAKRDRYVRAKRKRESRQEAKVTNHVPIPMTLNREGDTVNVTLRAGAAPALVLQAVRDGCSTIKGIVANTNCDPAPVKMALNRLVKKGVIHKVRHGVYALTAVASTSPTEQLEDSQLDGCESIALSIGEVVLQGGSAPRLDKGWRRLARLGRAAPTTPPAGPRSNDVATYRGGGLIGERKADSWQAAAGVFARHP